MNYCDQVATRIRITYHSDLESESESESESDRYNTCILYDMVAIRVRITYHSNPESESESEYESEFESECVSESITFRPVLITGLPPESELLGTIQVPLGNPNPIFSYKILYSDTYTLILTRIRLPPEFPSFRMHQNPSSRVP